MSERGLRPFFSYYGSKWRLARYYPPPRYATIVEPFAGSAGYSLLYPDRAVVLVDKDPVVAGLWNYLIRVPASEIMRIPALVRNVDEDLAGWPQEARWLVGFWMNRGSRTPCKTLGKWGRQVQSGRYTGLFWREKVRTRVASQVERIRHWRARCGTYRDAPDIEATWYVDPPYQAMGKYYRMGARDIDFADLGAWCRSRRGQVMVCENAGARWLPFRFFRRQWSGNRIRGIRRYSSAAHGTEVVWTQDSSALPALLRLAVPGDPVPRPAGRVIPALR